MFPQRCLLLWQADHCCHSWAFSCELLRHQYCVLEMIHLAMVVVASRGGRHPGFWNATDVSYSYEDFLNVSVNVFFEICGGQRMETEIWSGDDESVVHDG